MSDRVIHLHQVQLTSDRHITDPAFAINVNISLRHAPVSSNTYIMQYGLYMFIISVR